MINKEHDKIVILLIIAGRNLQDELLGELTQTGARLINAVFARGTVKASYIMNVLGLVPEENKTMITCVVSEQKADGIMKILSGKFDFDKPNTGIAFTIPIEKFSY